MRVDEHTIELASSPAFYRSASAAGVPPVYLHGLPTSSDDWEPLLERTGGFAPDLIGFGRSGKAGHLDYTLAGLADFVAYLLEELAIPRFSLVGHQWGAAVALELAARGPAQIAGLVLIDPLPLLDDFEWSGLARVLRLPVAGELIMGATVRPLLERRLRAGSAAPDEVWTEGRLDAVWRSFDQGTQRAILRLHRSTDPHHLAGLAERLGALDTPALVLHGERDPWVSVAQAEGCARLLRQATVTEIPGAGHWPWLERPDAIDTVARFLEQIE